MTDPSNIKRILAISEQLVVRIDHIEETLKSITSYGQTPHEHATVAQSEIKCFQGGNHPHLYHTDNPQLNNIADILSHIVSHCCNEKLTKIMELLGQLQNSIKNSILSEGEDMSQIRELLHSIELKQLTVGPVNPNPKPSTSEMFRTPPKSL